MTQVAGDVITCPGCGPNYKNKPEWAGRTGKCKCGSVLPTGGKAPMPKAAIAAASGLPTKPQLTRARATMEESGTGNGLKIGLIVGAVVLVIGAIVGFKMLQGEGGPDPATLKGDDARVIAWAPSASSSAAKGI